MVDVSISELVLVEIEGTVELSSIVDSASISDDDPAIVELGTSESTDMVESMRSSDIELDRMVMMLIVDSIMSSLDMLNLDIMDSNEELNVFVLDSDSVLYEVDMIVEVVSDLLAVVDVLVLSTIDISGLTVPNGDIVIGELEVDIPRSNTLVLDISVLDIEEIMISSLLDAIAELEITTMEERSEFSLTATDRVVVSDTLAPDVSIMVEVPRLLEEIILSGLGVGSKLDSGRNEELIDMVVK